MFRICQADAIEETKIFEDQGCHISRVMSKQEAVDKNLVDTSTYRHTGDKLKDQMNNDSRDRLLRLAISCVLIWRTYGDRLKKRQPMEIIEWPTGQIKVTWRWNGNQWKANSSSS